MSQKSLPTPCLSFKGNRPHNGLILPKQLLGARLRTYVEDRGSKTKSKSVHSVKKIGNKHCQYAVLQAVTVGGLGAREGQWKEGWGSDIIAKDKETTVQMHICISLQECACVFVCACV